MIKKRAAFFCGLLLFMLQFLYANWGGDAGGSVATGAFKAIGTDQVEMQNENLLIRLYRDRAKVQVDYVLKNSGNAVDVKAGFPCLGLGKWTEIEGYHLNVDGNDISYQQVSGDATQWKRVFTKELLENIEDESGEDARVLWLTSTVHFEKEQTRNIRIEYESLYQYSFGGPSEDSYHADDYFRYFLSTAASWKGPIQKGKVVILPVTMHNQITIKPLNRFHKTSDGYVWEFSNLHPTIADDVEVCMNNKFYTRFNYSDWDSGPTDRRKWSWYSFEGKNYFFDSNYFTALSSSNKEGYSTDNIKDSDWKAAWVAGKNGGIGESVALTLTRPQHIDQIGIIPGYSKSKELYFANNRIRELEIVVNDNKTITAALDDEFISFGADSYKGYQLINLGSYSGDAKSIKLRIKKVYPGSKYNNTCIGEILLRQQLKQKPEVHGAR